MKAEYINKEDVLELVMHYCPDDDGSCSNLGDIRDLLDEIEALPSLIFPNDIAGEAEKKNKTNKALMLLLNWAEECGFGYDNFPEEYERYENDIEDMDYIEGMIYIAEKVLEEEAE